MKTKTTKTISALLLLGSTLAFGTGNDSLYMGNVGRINPSISQILIGEVQVSKIDIRFATIEWKLIYSKRHIR